MKNLQAMSEDQIRQRIKSTPLLSRTGPHIIDQLLQEITRRKANRRKP